MLAKAKLIGPRAVSREGLEWAHEPRYLELAEREIRGGYDHLSTGDTNIGPESWDATLAESSDYSPANLGPTQPAT